MEVINMSKVETREVSMKEMAQAFEGKRFET